MSRSNPFTAGFGRVPSQMVPRTLQQNDVLDMLLEGDQGQQAIIVTGPRGSGKTVFMTEVARDVDSRSDWIVVDLNVERDLLMGLAAKLSSKPSLSNLFRDAKIDLSLFGLGLTVARAEPIADIEVALQRMIEAIGRRGKRILVTIDEAVSNVHMRAFAGTFQMLVRRNLPIHLIMTGLYENVSALQNERSLTFLYRAPKIILEPLGIRAMARSYRSVFDIDDDKALSMAHLTCGYSYAFQLLGYLVWEYQGLSEEVVERLRDMLFDLSYDKIWAELSPKDRLLTHAIAATPSGVVGEVREAAGMSTNEFNPYRRRLVQRGLLDGSRRGYVSLTLPFFGEYALERYGEVEPD